MSWVFRYFSEDEFDHPEKIDLGLLARLDLARVTAGVPFKITSDFREKKEGDKPSAHHLGKAVDIACTDARTRYRILAGVRHAGFARIGIYDRHIHVDVATEEDGFDQDVIWWGQSK